MNKREKGTEYERIASEYLKGMGYEIVMLNYRCKIGEIDIIAKEDGYLVFVEVKYRKNLRNGNPFEAIDYRKQIKIRKICEYYLLEHNLMDVAIRFDAVGILGNEIELIKNAF